MGLRGRAGAARVLVAALVLAAASCSGNAGSSNSGDGSSGGSTTPPPPPPLPLAPHHGEQEAREGLRSFFARLDVNRDGEVGVEEAQLFVGESGFRPETEGWAPEEAVRHMQAELDGTDRGVTVSEHEVELHLQDLLQDHRVVDWVVHGLNLPQYADTFRLSAITALDFPLLVNGGGALLESELGVASLLHQQQILRGLKRLILGLGQAPSPPRQLECALNGRSSVWLSWQRPLQLGHPFMHKYVLQRQRQLLLGNGSSAPAGSWEDAGEPDDEDSSWMDAPGERGTYRWRLAGWNAYGRSEWAVSSAMCSIKAPALAPGINATAAGGRAALQQASSWSWSAATSVAVVLLSMALKASQLRLARAALRMLHSAFGRVPQPGSPSSTAADPLLLPPLPSLRRVTSSRVSLPSLDSSQVVLSRPARGQQLDSLPAQYNVANGSPDAQQQEYEQGAGPQPPGGQQPGEQQHFEGLGSSYSAPLEGATNEQPGARCALEGCPIRFDRLRDLKNQKLSHYCGQCQHVYCQEHTRISGHGALGSCGLKRSCVCIACFTEMAPAQQEAWERRNRLPPRPQQQQQQQQGGPAAEGTLMTAPSGLSPGPSQELAPSSAEGSRSPAQRRWRQAGTTVRAAAALKAALLSAKAD